MKLPENVNEWVQDLPVYEPGKPIEEVARELGFDSADAIIKVASNENSLGPSPKAVEAARSAASTLHRYPDGSCFYLRRKLAGMLDLDPAQLIFGNGSNELLELLGHACLGPGRHLVMSERAFLIYRFIGAAFQSGVTSVPMKGWTHDLEAMAGAVREETRLLFVANPNNPTGTMVDQAQLDRLVEQLPKHVTLVIDEAYIELVPPERRPDVLGYLRAGKPVVVLRTFSKAYGLAGLRLGYALASPEVVQALNQVRQPFNVNSVAQAAALAALDDRAHVESTQQMVLSGLAQLAGGFEALGLAYVPSVANFILVNVGRGRECFERLLREKVVVRAMDAYGCPDHVRVTVGTEEENRHFLEALERVLEQRKE